MERVLQKRICHIYLRDFIKEKVRISRINLRTAERFNEDNGNLSVSSEMEYKSESVGIGLALSRSIITQFNGTIKITSEVGQGTSFDIRFYKAIV